MTTAQVLAGNKPAKAEDDDRIFCCTKDQLAKAVQKMALQFTKWGEQHIVEQEHMLPGLVNKLQESLKNSDKIISNLIQEKKEMQENFYHNVRLATANAVADIYAELASKSVEINDLRKTRRIDEKKIRNKIIDEYDDLVSELVMENHVMRNRFNEYRTNTVQEMVGIIAETKREELVQLTESAEIPDQLKASALRTIEHDEEIKELNDELHEVNMTLMKVRTMYTIKEQSLRSSFNKKIKTLTEENKKAEEKLWDSYRNAEAREQTLRKIISKNSKDLLIAETRNDILQRQFKDEQTKLRQTASKNDRTVSARVRVDHSSSHEARMTDAVEKLKYYEKINVEKLLLDLKEKTEIIEDMLQKKRNEAKTALQAQAAMVVLPSKTSPDAPRPSTAAPAFNKAKRSPVDDLLFRLAASTEENNELKRKLSILTVGAAAKKLVNSMPAGPTKGEMEKSRVFTTERGVQTETMNSSSQKNALADVDMKLEPIVRPYADTDMFTMSNFDEVQFDDVDDDDLDDNFLARRNSMAVAKNNKIAAARPKRDSVSASVSTNANNKRSSTSANISPESIRTGSAPSRRSSMKQTDSKRSNQNNSIRISIPSQPQVMEHTAEYIIESGESPRKSKRASVSSAAALRLSQPHRMDSAQLTRSLNIGGHGIPGSSAQMFPNVSPAGASMKAETAKKSVWDDIYDYQSK